MNNDGNLDVIVYNVGAPPSLFLNETHNANHRIVFKLTGTKGNREAVGARVTVTTSTMTQSAEVHAGSGYLSSSDQRLHFGLGLEPIISRVVVQWPGGGNLT